MIGEEPFELEPEDAPRRPPSTVTIGRGDGTGVRQWRRRGLVLLGIVAVVAAMTIATRGDGDERAAPAESTTTSRSRTTTTQRSTTTSPPSTVGQLLGEPTGVTLVVQNDRGVDVVDLDTGKTRQLLGEFAPLPKVKESPRQSTNSRARRARRRDLALFDPQPNPQRGGLQA
ncbi:MAG: hypothetical protein L0221_02705, partial [Chloroflexi bacterium]|nr:hypothetical protein [Chloroflexota bacterium]